MNFKALSIGLLFFFIATSAYSQNDRDASLINSLNVKTKNRVEGEVIADDHSEVTVGGVEISGSDVKSISVNSDNRTKDIESTGGSVVSVGGVKISNVNADNITIKKSKNRVEGKITATEGSVVSIGSTNLSNIDKAGTIIIDTDNKVSGEVKATGGSKVNIGGVSVN